MSLVSIDIETTGLDPEVHRPWEVALVEEDGTEHHWGLNPTRETLAAADPGALQVSRYYERLNTEEAPPWWGYGYGPTEDPIRTILRVTSNATLMGCAPHFDARFVEDYLRRNGWVPAWRHRFLDLGTYAAGVLGRPEPLSSRAMQKEVIPNKAEHTALGDARWNWLVWRNLRLIQREQLDRRG